MKDETILEKETELVRKLRYTEKLKYKEIAEKLNRSLYWVHCRLSDKYKPAGSRVEKRFQDQDVISYLEKEGHKIIKNNTRTKWGVKGTFLFMPTIYAYPQPKFSQNRICNFGCYA